MSSCHETADCMRSVVSLNITLFCCAVQCKRCICTACHCLFVSRLSAHLICVCRFPTSTASSIACCCSWGTKRTS